MHISHNEFMVPWVPFPNKPISVKWWHSEERAEADSTGLHYLESTMAVASGRAGWAVPVTSQALPSAALLLNKLGSVSDWERLVSVDVLFSKPHRRGKSCKMTNLPGNCLEARRAPACPGKSNLHFFQRNAVAAGLLITYICLNDEGKDAEEVDNKSSFRTAHWDVLCSGGFSFSHERIWLNRTQSPLNTRQEVTLSS